MGSSLCWTTACTADVTARPMRPRSCSMPWETGEGGESDNKQHGLDGFPAAHWASSNPPRGGTGRRQLQSFPSRAARVFLNWLPRVGCPAQPAAAPVHGRCCPSCATWSCLLGLASGRSLRGGVGTRRANHRRQRHGGGGMCGTERCFSGLAARVVLILGRLYLHTPERTAGGMREFAL